jgi:hypothetical protein
MIWHALTTIKPLKPCAVYLVSRGDGVTWGSWDAENKKFLGANGQAVYGATHWGEMPEPATDDR